MAAATGREADDAPGHALETGMDFFVGDQCIERPLSCSLRYRTRVAFRLAGSLTPHGTFETRHFALATIPNEAVCSYSNGH